MNRKEFRDLLVKTSNEGGFPCIDENRSCLYRFKGKACVAGLCIPDNKYYPGLESKTVNHELVREVIVLPEGVSLTELMRLQSIHDDLACSRKGWDHEKFVSRIDEVFDGRVVDLAEVD